MCTLNIFSHLWHQITLEPIAFSVSVAAVLYFVIQKIVEGKISHEYDKKLENYKYEMTRREQAVKIASVFAKRFSQPQYAEINQLLWELSLWLPVEKYKKLCEALKQSDNDDGTQNKSYDPRQLLVDIRKELKTPGELSKEDIVRYN